MRVSNILIHKVGVTSFKKSITKDRNTSEQSSLPQVNLNHTTTTLPQNIIQKVSPLKNTRAEFSKEDLSSIISRAISNDKNSEKPIIKTIQPQFISDFAQRICEKGNKNIVIGLSGESASGKSTICDTIKEVAEEQNMPVEIISADNYFKDISGLIKQYGSFDGVIESGYDVDSPDNFYMEQLHDDLEQLVNGNDVRIPQYLVNGTGISVPQAIPKKAQKVIIVEGLATLYSPVRDILDAEIFVDIDRKVQEKRYIERAKAARNQTEEDAKAQFEYVCLAAEKYIQPKKDSADIIIDGSVDKEHYKETFNKLFSAFKK